MRSDRAHAPSLARNTDGTAALELTVLLPFLFALSFGVFEFGHLIYQYHLMTSGVRDAARYLSGNPYRDESGGGPSAAAEAAARNIAMRGTADASGDYRISWWNDANTINIATDTGNDTGYRGGAVTIIKVRTSVPYQSLGFLEFLGIEPITLTASHEERMYQSR
jgi:Flp pilus assembly protein TadG